MQDVLSTIAKQANLDRVLFTPAVKQLYFDMAVAGGGGMQFKHADTTRNGIAYATDKADDKKRALLFCSFQELFTAYDHFIRIANDLVPVVILALREEVRAKSKPNLSPLFLRDSGWIQFWTHTYQEAYDHLAIAYALNQEKQIRVPVMIMQSAMDGGDQTEYTAGEDLDLGSPLKGLESSRAGKPKMSFEDAFEKMKRKKEPPSLPNSYRQLASALPDLYSRLGYEATADSLPLVGKLDDADVAILSLLPAPADIEANGYTGDGVKCAFLRPLCYRPLAFAETARKLGQMKALAVVEPAVTPGVWTPPFFSEVAALLCSISSTRLFSVTIPTEQTVLKEAEIVDIVQKLAT